MNMKSLCFLILLTAAPAAALADGGPVGIGFVQAEEGTWWCRAGTPAKAFDCARDKCKASKIALAFRLDAQQQAEMQCGDRSEHDRDDTNHPVETGKRHALACDEETPRAGDQGREVWIAIVFRFRSEDHWIGCKHRIDRGGLSQHFAATGRATQQNCGCRSTSENCR